MKEEIVDYEIKAKYLRDNGWVTNWHYDNWILSEDLGKGLPTEYMGQSTDSAYRYEKGLRKIDDLVQVRSLPNELPIYKNWTTVTRVLATGLVGVEVRELK